MIQRLYFPNCNMNNTFFYKRLGLQIRRERRMKDFSQEDLSFETDIDRAYLAKIEKGRANPSIKILYKISRKLKITLSDLLKGV